MRVLMISEFYPPHIGGVEQYVQSVSRQLVQRGHQVAVAAMQYASSPPFECDRGVHVYRLAGWNRALAPLYENREHLFHPPLPDPGIMAGLRRVIKQERPDIVHAHGWPVYSFIGLKAWSKAKLVVTLHQYSLTCPTKLYLHENRVCTGPGYTKCISCASSQHGAARAVLLTGGLRLSSLLHRYVDHYLAVSSAVRDACINGTGGRPIEVVPNIIPDDTAEIAARAPRPAFFPPQDNYIAFAGRQSPYKGLDVLLEAYTGLSDLAPLVVMVGADGSSSRQFSGDVRVACDVPHEQVLAAWAHSAAAVVPSIWPDPCPTVAIEAMACGRPVVASALGGLRDIVVHGETGLLVPPGDAGALREALRTLLMDPVRRERMGAAGSQRARLFTSGRVVARIEQIYSELLSRPLNRQKG